MKLLIITREFPPIKTGDAAHAFHLAERMAKVGVEVHVLTSVIKDVVQHPSFSVSPVMHRWSWRGLPTLRNVLRTIAPDAILQLYIGRSHGDHPMLTFIPSIARALLPSVRFVTQFENPGISFRSFTRWARAGRKAMAWWVNPVDVSYFFGTLFRDSDHIIALCGPHRKTLSAEYPQLIEKCSVIPPPPLMRICDAEKEKARARGRHRLGIPEDVFLFGFYGYVMPTKGLEFLLSAFRNIALHHEKARLVIIGGPAIDPNNPTMSNMCGSYFQSLQQLARRLAIHDRVVWTGHCDPTNDEASSYLYASDACLLPFKHGVQLNNSSLAAVVSHELPTVTTRGEIVESPLVDRENVLLCDPDNEKDLTDAMEALINCPELYTRIREGAQKLAYECFSWDKTVERTIGILRGTQPYTSPIGESTRI
jgi:glycosyltransferase involved in cell wall biosynthesis